MSQLGFNTGYVEELYRQYLDNPKSVSENWQEFFADYKPGEGFVAAAEARPVQRAAEAPSGDGAAAEGEAPAPPPFSPEEAEFRPLRGAAARIVENMEASLGVPTATSSRTIPVKLLSENRKLINDYQRDVGGEKVSFTHLIAWAIVKALKAVPSMNTTLFQDNGSPQHVLPRAVNLGLAIDLERKGKRSLVVPNIKGADRLTFAGLLGAYNDIIARARDGRLEVSDFQGTTATLTNPGMIGTAMSVPRLMPGQGVIVAVGAIGYPPEYHAFPPAVTSKMGMSEVMTITSTYDHRVIQGAESGAFLAYITELLLGEHHFYQEVFSDLCLPTQPLLLSHDSTPMIGEMDGAEFEMIRKQAGVLQLIRAYRVRGHLQADINPLGYKWTYHPELDPLVYGLTIWDLDRKFITGGLGGKDLLPLRESLGALRRSYTRKIGVEYMHISQFDERQWIQDRIEEDPGAQQMSREARKRMLHMLNAAEAFERFLHTKYVGHKRFSLEGAETLIPILDAFLSDAADAGSSEAVIGMAHRGRLNVLANVLNKPYEAIFSEFEGSIDPSTIQGSGDVKYHLGAKGVHKSLQGAEIRLTLASNPSHLEAVSPVVEGMVRARQDRMRDRENHEDLEIAFDSVVPILIHGDAAFAGQGVVTETLNLSQLKGYRTGGTIHIVVNNQIGFTTTPADARSSTYATDVARMIQAPIFHVNGDDPEACVRVARIAFEYRQEFNKDVVIDMLCYRVHGHNEGDEPTYTQPLLYRKIEGKRSVRKLYTESLMRRGEMTPDDAEQMLDDYRALLQEAFERTKEIEDRDPREVVEALRKRKAEAAPPPEVDTRPRPEDVQAVTAAIARIPEGFEIHKKLERQFERRDKQLADEGRVDWALAEALAFGTLLLEGTPVRLSGQDSRRGTFSHRHGVLYDQSSGAEYIPLNHIREDQAPLLIFDSLLSEYAVCAFEYGYSIGSPETLVLWEAQFGDFANGAQIVFDQFLSAAEEKWGQRSSLVLLLPHGYEGQGPEHSSARLERFLQLCAENNMVVCAFTSPANLFHALRRQKKRETPKPLVVMAPKSLLRHPMMVSTTEDLLAGGFQELIPAATDPEQARRLIFCSGKVYFDLAQALEARPEVRERIAVARLEQFYPFPAEQVKAELARYGGVQDVVWLQDEPANMGAWSFVRPRFDALLEAQHGDCRKRILYIGRQASASTATGSNKVHQLEQEQNLNLALTVSGE